MTKFNLTKGKTYSGSQEQDDPAMSGQNDQVSFVQSKWPPNWSVPTKGPFPRSLANFPRSAPEPSGYRLKR